MPEGIQTEDPAMPSESAHGTRSTNVCDYEFLPHPPTHPPIATASFFQMAE